MMLPEWLNTAGLVFNMAGVVTAFFFGFLQPLHTDALTPDKIGEDTIKLKASYERLSKIGLGLMFAGFAFQLIATWFARSS
jgi:hypothetical protein